MNKHTWINLTERGWRCERQTRPKFTLINNISSLICISEEQSSLRPLIFACLWSVVLASLVWVHLEATLLDDRKAFSLTGHYFHPPRVRNLYHRCGIREFRELHARGKVKGVAVLYRENIVGEKHYCYDAWRAICFERRRSFDIQPCYFLARHPSTLPALFCLENVIS